MFITCIYIVHIQGRDICNVVISLFPTSGDITVKSSVPIDIFNIIDMLFVSCRHDLLKTMLFCGFTISSKKVRDEQLTPGVLRLSKKALRSVKSDSSYVINPP